MKSSTRPMDVCKFSNVPDNENVGMLASMASPAFLAAASRPLVSRFAGSNMDAKTVLPTSSATDPPRLTSN